MREYWDSTVETSTSTGTGNITLAGAVLGYQRFDNSVSVGSRVTVLIEAIDGNGDRTGEWEVSDATYSATDTLARTTFLDGSNYPSATNFSAGTKRVSLILAAKAVRYRGALVTKAADQTAANYTTATAIAWDTESGGYDTGGVFHDNVTNNTRLTIPDGTDRVRLKAHVAISNFVGSQWYALYIYKNGSNSYVGSPGMISYNNITTAEIEAETPVLDVVAGDYFEAVLQVGSDTSITVIASRSWFAIEVLE